MKGLIITAFWTVALWRFVVASFLWIIQYEIDTQHLRFILIVAILTYTLSTIKKIFGFYRRVE